MDCCRRRLMRVSGVSAVFLLLCASGCGKKAPDEANASLNNALSSLAKGDAQAFVSGVVPAQREKVATLGEWGFFQAVKSHKIDNEFDLNVTDDAASIMVTLYFDDEQKAFSTMYFVMNKIEGAWCIDLDETIKKERETDGAQAFQVWTFEQQQ